MMYILIVRLFQLLIIAVIFVLHMLETMIGIPRLFIVNYEIYVNDQCLKGNRQYTRYILQEIIGDLACVIKIRK